MTGMTMLAIAIVVLLVGYFGYAKWLEKKWGGGSLPPDARGAF